jgi:hypothetical protein
MRKAKIKGKDIIITEKAFKKLRSRFNPKNFKDSSDGEEIKNKQTCYFCMEYDPRMHHCCECPFVVLADYELGCFAAIRSILNKNEKRIFRNNIWMFDDGISYCSRSKRAGEVIAKIYSAINEGFKKVKRR